MSENAKTITFVVVGLLAIVVGLATRPSSADLDVETLVGENLTKHFDSPEEAKRLRIVRFDEDTATLREFEVAEQEGLWTIPSKSGYPADAARQMAEAATSLMDRKILDVASHSAGDHEEYGVIDPLSPKLEPGQKGVGTRVTMSDVHNEPLADLIVGKAVKDAEGQRYVREAGRDIVYVIEFDRSKLSTSFEDWIEKDLLKLNSWDLQQVDIKDYSAELVPVMTRDGKFGVQPTWDPRAEMTLAYNDTEGKWNAVKLRKFDPKAGEQGDYVEFSLAEDEELNDKSLNDLKSALDDLQIVDVVRKPQGLSEDLKAGEDFMNNREALQDLMSKGFTPAATAEGAADEIISSDGEVIATMKNGTEYVLRFGNLTNMAGEEQEKEQATEAAAADSAASKAKDSDVNRYLFVMARFNEGVVKQPELQQLPELPAKGEATTPDTSESKDQAATEAKEEPAQSPQASSEGQDGDKKEGEPAPDAPAPEGEPSTDEAKAGQEAEAEQDAEKKDQAGAADNPEKDKELENVIVERQRIEQENQRQLETYQATLQKGRETVKELNLRFGDWYFVVDDQVFRKIRLSREGVIKKKEQPKPETEGASPEGASGTSTPAAIPGLPQIPGANQ
ncbi:MAG: DUF4340 domain-containing protein [Pirellulales bacterium]